MGVFWTRYWNKMIPIFCFLERFISPIFAVRPGPKVFGQQVQSEWRPSEPPLGCFRVLTFLLICGTLRAHQGETKWSGVSMKRKWITDPASQDTCHQRHELAPLLSRDSGDAHGDAWAGSNLVCGWVWLLFVHSLAYMQAP